MISPIDIISYDTRPQEFEAPALPVQGPSFSDHLVRAEDERSRSGQLPETASTASDAAGPLNEAEGVRPGGEPRTDSGEAAPENGAPERAGESAEKVNADSDAKDGGTAAEKAGTATEKAGIKSAEKGDETRETSAAGSRASSAAERKKAGDAKAGDAKAADAGQTLLQQKETFDRSREAGDAAAGEAAAQITQAAQAEAEILPAGEAAAGQKLSGKETPLQTEAEALLSDANPLLQPLAKDVNQAKEASGAREKGAERRDGRSPAAPAARSEESRPALELVDLRRTGRGEAEARHSGSGAESGETRTFAAGNQLSAENGQNVRQEVMLLETTGGRNEAAGLKGEALPSRAAEELAKALREGGNNEILKRARITLKDASQGEIRLILKPERLGEVQIRLNLSDRHIAGRIIVENSSVREVFQENMEALNRAFRESGYQSAGLEVSVGGREGSFGRQKERAGAARSAARGAAMLDEQVPRVHSDQYAMSRINVYV